MAEAVLIQLSVEWEEAALNSRDEWGANKAPELTTNEGKRRCKVLDKDESTGSEHNCE